MDHKKEYENPNLKLTYFSYVITDEKFNIKDYDREFYHFIEEKEDLLNKKLSIFFPKAKFEKLNIFVEVKSLNGNLYEMKQSKIEINNSEFYMFFFIDNSLTDELESQIDYLNKQQYLYSEMFNKLEEGIYMTDEKGKTIYVNDAFLNLSGLSRDDLIGKTVYDLRDWDVLPNSCCAKVIETKDSVSTINNYYTGQKCLVSGSPIRDEKGNLKRTIAVVRDVSELEMLMKSIAKEETLSMSFSKRMEELGTKAAEREIIITKNSKMKSLYEKADRLADVDSSILILGETGVGKDFLTTYIHTQSPRKDRGNLIKINCGAIPEHLIESELFGYEEGAFTGAQRGGKKGLFEEAGEGTIFLDEIGDMPYTLQVKLLNALNDKKFYRIGGNRAIEFKARIIAATNANLKELVKEKKFRSDLYYRLNVVTLYIPPLRERKEDILPLASNFLDYYNSKHRRNCYFTPECMESFLMYKWPGNIRELKNIIERMILISEDVTIDESLFREQVSQEPIQNEMTELFQKSKSRLPLKEQMEIHEKGILERALSETETLKEAAERLKVDVSTIVRKKQKYNID
ncbi:MAG: sigma 54-interacting transcriptional regulator [Tissierellales bacterium]|jgi:PAS domain S-box-containing protein|nr:sigma 54-interacting transcriptional regulator [Tissierellales bacterium]